MYKKKDTTSIIMSLLKINSPISVNLNKHLYELRSKILFLYNTFHLLHNKQFATVWFMITYLICTSLHAITGGKYVRQFHIFVWIKEKYQKPHAFSKTLHSLFYKWEARFLISFLLPYMIFVWKCFVMLLLYLFKLPSEQ